MKALGHLIALCIPFCLMVSTLAFPPEYDHGISLPTTRPLVIAHRGASGVLPEHTVAAYKLAIDQGANIIECDVSVTKDLELVCLHESWMNETTDVANKFPDRLRTYYVDDQGRNITDYFTVDLTLEELKTLRVNQRFGSRDPSKNGQYPIATLQEYIEVAKAASRPMGIYPETKEPEWINSLAIIQDANTTFERLLIDVLHSYDYTKPTDPCFVQSFNLASLYRLTQLTNLPLIKLSRTPLANADLDEVAEFCYGIGPSKTLIVKVSSDNNTIYETTDLVERAHARGLRVHPYTFRNEDSELAFDYGLDPFEELQYFLELEIDGYFTDFSSTLVRYFNATYLPDTDNSATSFKPFSFTCALIVLSCLLYVMYI